MLYTKLLNQAYSLCIRFNSPVILNDLAYMTESELFGLITFLNHFHRS